MKISILMAMPAAKGLFHRAIVPSGLELRVVEQDHSRVLARELLSELGIDRANARALLDVPAAQLMMAAFAVERRSRIHPASMS